MLMGNISATSVLGVGTIGLKLTSGKTVHLKNVQHAPTINMNLISVSLLCRDVQVWKLYRQRLYKRSIVPLDYFGLFI
jgi:hypothetical protein